MLNSCSDSTKLAACFPQFYSLKCSFNSQVSFSAACCLFSPLWWTVAWTLRCTMPSAVKHNATRLYHSHVWGYRWPAVCLCSSPLGQLEPSISAPTPTPPEPRCVRLHRPDHHKNNMRLSHLVCRSSGGHFSASINTNIVSKVFFYQALRTRFLNFHCGNFLLKLFLLIAGLGFLLQSSPWEQFYDASDGHKLIHCWFDSMQHVQSQAVLPPQMESIETHYCVLGGASSTMNSLAHF